jgi:cysteine desulfuration protein SufE
MIESKMKEVLDKFRQAKEMENAGMEYLTYKTLIDAGKKLEPYPEDQRTEDNLVTKCTSTVHMIGESRDGSMFYTADSDAAFVKGELGILLGLFNGESSEVILNDDTKTLFTNFFEELQNYVSISMNRTQGFFGMFEKIRELANKPS